MPDQTETDKTLAQRGWLAPASTQDGPFSTIPLEILLLINKECTTLSTIALALTCKPLYVCLFPKGRMPFLGVGERVRLLRRLEADVPNSFLCFGCTRLQSIDPEKPLGRQSPGEVQKIDPSPHNHYDDDDDDDDDDDNETNKHKPVSPPRRQTWRPNWTPGAEVHFETVYLIMNQHLYGPSRGIPAEALDQHFAFERYLFTTKGIGRERPDGWWQLTRAMTTKQLQPHFPLSRHPLGQAGGSPALQDDLLAMADGWGVAGYVTGPWRFTHDYVTRIVDGQLLVGRFHSMTGPFGAHVPVAGKKSLQPEGATTAAAATTARTTTMAQKFRRATCLVNLPVCTHLGCPSRLTEYGRLDLSQDVTIPQMRPRAGDCDRASGSCEYCFTDYVISIHGLNAAVDESDGDHGPCRFELATYHRLGRCRSPADPAWKCLTTISKGYPESTPGYRPGGVWRKWYRGRGEDVDYGPSWARPPKKKQ